MSNKKLLARKRRHNRIRSKIKGTEKRPRLMVKRTLLYTYANLIDDEQGKILLSVSDMKDTKKGTKIEKAKRIGEEIAAKAKEKKITEIVFDRGGYKYHGRVKAIAQSAREGGLKF